MLLRSSLGAAKKHLLNAVDVVNGMVDGSGHVRGVHQEIHLRTECMISCLWFYNQTNGLCCSHSMDRMHSYSDATLKD